MTATWHHQLADPEDEIVALLDDVDDRVGQVRLQRHVGCSRTNEPVAFFEFSRTTCNTSRVLDHLAVLVEMSPAPCRAVSSSGAPIGRMP